MEYGRSKVEWSRGVVRMRSSLVVYAVGNWV